MDMATLKGLELVLIIGVVAWFFLKQRQSLAQAKAELEAKRAAEGEASKSE